MEPVDSTHPLEAHLMKLHATYCVLTDRTERYQMHARAWHDFHANGFTEADLTLVIRHVNARNKQLSKERAIRLSLIKLLDLETFDSLRADAEQERKALAARARKVQPSQGSVELAKMRGEPEPVVEQAERKVSMAMLIDGLRKAANQ